MCTYRADCNASEAWGSIVVAVYVAGAQHWAGVCERVSVVVLWEKTTQLKRNKIVSAVPTDQHI